jgi:hypothetical protein
VKPLKVFFLAIRFVAARVHLTWGGTRLIRGWRCPDGITGAY